MDKAILELSDKLRHPSDINTKLESIQKNSRESSELYDRNFNSKLSTCYDVINDISEGIANLNIEITDFKETKKKNFSILKDFAYLIKDYKTVKLICHAHQSFIKIKQFIENMKTIEDDCKDEDIETYHNNIYSKEEFMCELELYNYNLSAEEFSRIDSFINSIKRQSLEFTTLILELIEDFMTNHEHLSVISEIIEKEEKRDLLTTKAQEGDRNKDPELHEISKMYPRYLTRICKKLEYKAKVVLKATIKQKFKALEEKHLIINKLGFVLDDLDFIYKKINLGFFSFNDFLIEYHNNLKNLIERNIETLDAGEILALVEFKTDYYNTIEAKYNKVAESLGPKIVENESDLLEKYSITASAKLKEWIDNIAQMEVEKFQTRDSELNRDEENKLISPGFINLLQIIKVQLEPIAFNKKVFTFITNTVKQHCETFKNKIMDEVEKDFIPSCQNKSKPGFEDYCIMFGNSGLKLTQYITSLPQCQNEEVRDLGNIFMSILKTCNCYLSEFIIYTCNPVIKQIFTKEWIKENTTKVLAMTIEDFLQDYYNTMCSFSFVTFVYELCNCLSEAYIKRLRSKDIELSTRSSEAMQRDYDCLFDIFTLYAKKDDVKDSLGPFLKIIPLLKANNEEMFVIELKAIKLINSTIDSSFVKNIIKKRIDLDDEVKTQLILSAKEVLNETKQKKKNLVSKFLKK